MSSYYFIKLYHEILDDPRMGRLPDRLWRRFLELALIANQQPGQDGILPTFDNMSWILRIHRLDLSQDLNELRRQGLVDYTRSRWFIINFAGKFRTEVSHYDTPEWKAARAVILERDNHTCQYCGETASHVDHIVPIVQGGDDTEENLVAACRSCNLHKSGRTPEEANMKLIGG